ncbi:hypothetical protein ACLKA6_007114 [Drosophila palustris]
MSMPKHVSSQHLSGHVSRPSTKKSQKQLRLRRDKGKKDEVVVRGTGGGDILGARASRMQEAADEWQIC